MKNNILHRFALHDLKNHCHDTICMSIIIFVVTLATLLIYYLIPVIQNYNFLEYQYQYGTENCIIKYENFEEIDDLILTFEGKTISLDDEMLKTCIKMNVGYTLNHESIHELNGNCQVVGTHLKDGRMPENEDEIVVKEKFFENWGYPNKLNQKIKMIYPDEKPYLREFLVVGTLENTGGTDILVKNCASQSGEIWIDVVDDEKRYDLKANREIAYIGNSTIDDFGMSIESRAIFLTMIQAAVTIVSVALLYGMTLSSFEKRQKDYTLMRSIGATNRQLYYVVFLQSIILMIVPVILSLIIVFVISQIITWMNVLPFYVPLDFSSLYGGV